MLERKNTPHSDALCARICMCSWSAVKSKSNSKHWFTTSFFQPLPQLITPSVLHCYSSTNKTKIVWIDLELFLTWGGCISWLCARNRQWEWKFGFPTFYMMPLSLSTSVDYQHSNRVLEETVFLYLHDTCITDKLFSPKRGEKKRRSL